MAGQPRHGRAPDAPEAPLMEVRIERPPLWADIDTKFHVAGKKVIFSWGDIIYNPEGITIPPELFVHEKVHGIRQLSGTGDVLDWWHHYIQNEDFRYAEELLAHRAEYEFLAQGLRDRNSLNRLLVRTAARLGAPLYDYSRRHSQVELIRDLKR